MKSKQPTTRILLKTVLALFLGSLLTAAAYGQIYVANFGTGTIGKYDATTGAAINASLVSGLNGPIGIALSGGHLYVANSGAGTIGEYDAATGATMNASLVSGLYYPWGIAVSGGNIFVTFPYSNIGVGKYDATTGATVNAFSWYSSVVQSPTAIAVSGGNLFVGGGSGGQFNAVIGKYNATTGAVVNDPLVSDVSNCRFMAVSEGHLYVTEGYGDYGIGEYDAATGAIINVDLVPGLSGALGIAASGGNLFVATYLGGTSGTVGEYNATTGGTINATLVSGLTAPFGIAVGESYSAQLQQPINPDGSSVFSVKRGVVPVKFTVTATGAATCQLPPATISLIRTAGTAPGPIDQAMYLLASDNGSNFRVENCQYSYNLATSSLGAGTYTVNILIGGNIVGTGSFGLQ